MTEISLFSIILNDPVKAVLIGAVLLIIFLIYKDANRDKEELKDYRDGVQKFSQMIESSNKEMKEHSKTMSSIKTDIALDILNLKKQIVEVRGEITNYIQSLMTQQEIIQSDIKLSKNEISKRADELKAKLDSIDQINADLKQIYGRIRIIEEDAKMMSHSTDVIKDFASKLKKKRDELRRIK